MAKPSVTAPIVSATSLEQMEVLFQAARLQLDANSMDILDAASA
jgi:aryl-alcohol dehydrogenase-like predicted oxidoreductase